MLVLQPYKPVSRLKRDKTGKRSTNTEPLCSCLSFTCSLTGCHLAPWEASERWLGPLLETQKGMEGATHLPLPSKRCKLRALVTIQLEDKAAANSSEEPVFFNLFFNLGNI